MLSGCKILLQHRIKIDEEKIQILPPEQRTFPFKPPNQSSVDVETIAGLVTDSIDVGENVGLGESCVGASSSNERECDRLWEALNRDGFAYVRGTGMSRQVCEDALVAASKYFVVRNADSSTIRYLFDILEIFF